MKNNSQINPKRSLWKFGQYLYENSQKAYLVIHFPTRGKKCVKPLILPLSDHTKPSRVMNELINAGADISLKDIKFLEQNLQLNNLESGKYADKLGWFEGNFLTPNHFYGDKKINIVVQDKIMDAAEGHIDQRGVVDVWSEEIAGPSHKSSYLMFSIMMAFAAILQKLVFGGNEEGFIVNFFGSTSRGKTTALAIGKSFSGNPENLLRWNVSPRHLTEAAASASDTLLAIDDLDSIADKKSFGRDMAELTHLLASGHSHAYSVVMREQLPNLYWTCCVLTCGKDSVENLSMKCGHIRSQSDKVRLFDIPIPSLPIGGIWDRMNPGDDSGELTQLIREKVSSQYGTALPVWLEICVNNQKLLRDAKDLVDWYVSKIGIAPSAGMEHRIAKKFGLIFAAGILGEEQGILPWNRKRILKVVRKMHRLSMLNVYDAEHKSKAGLNKLVDLYYDEDKCPFFKADKKPSFKSEVDADCFVCEFKGDNFLYITITQFNTLFSDSLIATNGLEILKAKKVVHMTGRKSTVQKRVSFNQKSKKLRYLMINVEKFYSGDEEG